MGVQHDDDVNRELGVGEGFWHKRAFQLAGWLERYILGDLAPWV